MTTRWVLVTKFAENKEGTEAMLLVRAVMRRRRGAAGSADVAIISKCKNNFEKERSRSTKIGRGWIAAASSAAAADGGTEAAIAFGIVLATYGGRLVVVPKTAS